MTRPTQADGRPIDPERPVPDHGYDRMEGYSGQDYDRDRPLPDEDDQHLGIDPATGEVDGSGANVGGGGTGEDHDASPKGGGGYPATGHGDESTAIDRAG